jgi:cellobiose phosphorylase
LIVDPCIPRDWKRFTATRRFRGKTVMIDVRNPHGAEKGVKSLTLNGEVLRGNLIPADQLKDDNAVVVELG